MACASEMENGRMEKSGMWVLTLVETAVAVILFLVYYVFLVLRYGVYLSKLAPLQKEVEKLKSMARELGRA